MQFLVGSPISVGGGGEGAGRWQGRKQATDITKMNSPEVGFFGSENDFPAALQAPRNKDPVSPSL